MAENPRERRNDQPGQENEKSGVTGTENLERSVNKTTDDLDEKSSTLGRTDRGRSSGIATKDGLTGSDYDGQVAGR